MIEEAAREHLLRFRDSIVVPLANTDADKWPIRSGRISRLCLDEFSHEFFEDLQLLHEQGMTWQHIASLFVNPTHLWRMSHHLLNGLRLRSASLETQREAILTLLKLISYLKYGDIYCSNGANVIWPPIQIANLVEGLQSSDDTAIIKPAHQLAGVLWAYAECLYFVAHEISVEIHGPYPTPDGHWLLVRDFFNLHPYSLWPSIDSLVPYEKVRVMVVYKQFKGHLDVYNNLYLDADMRLADEAYLCKVLIDDHPATLSQIQQLIHEASRTITTISKLVDSWSLEEIARHYIHIFWWRKEGMSKALHKDWRPPAKVLNRVNAANIPDPATSNPSLEKLCK